MSKTNTRSSLTGLLRKFRSLRSTEELVFSAETLLEGFKKIERRQ